MLAAAELDKKAAYQIERVLRVTHSLDYEYLRPVRDVRTRLRLLPPAERGPGQRLEASAFHFAPLPNASLPGRDAWGNHVLEVRHETVWQHLTLVVDLTVRTRAAYASDGQVLPPLVPDTGETNGESSFRAPTALTTPDAALEDAAMGTLAAQPPHADAANQAFALCRRVFREMRYAPGATTIHTRAAETWADKKGVCQDYAHVLITLCRAAGLAARYVSGFLPGEGAMHAWVEVFLPLSASWSALDPTHDRWANERYIAVAHGRDYADISPSSGTFLGAGAGSTLRHRSRVVIENTVQTPLLG